MECAVCREPYNRSDRRPVAVVPCGHSCCDFCMGGQRARHNTQAVPCPFCREITITTVVNRGILDILDELEAKKNPPGGSRGGVTGAGECEEEGDDDECGCSRHGSAELRFVCPDEGCWKLCCAECIVEDHHGHPRPLRVEEANQQSATMAGSSLVKATARALTLDKAIKSGREALSDREQISEKLVKDIDEFVQELMEGILARREELVAQADAAVKTYTQELELQGRELAQQKASLGRSMEELKALLSQGHSLRFFRENKRLMRELDDAIALAVPGSGGLPGPRLSPPSFDRPSLEASKAWTRAWGFITGGPAPANTQPAAPSHSGGSMVPWVPPSPGQAVEAGGVILLPPPPPPAPSLSVRMTLHNLPGHGSLSYPRGVAVDDQSIFVCDWYNHRLAVFSRADGRFQRVLGVGHASYSPAGFNQPSDACVDGDLLFIADRSNHRVVVLDRRTGSYRHHLGFTRESGSDVHHFNSPTSVCVDGPHLYVADLENGRILKLLKTDGSYVAAFDRVDNTTTGNSASSSSPVGDGEGVEPGSPAAGAGGGEAHPRFEPVRLAVDGDFLYVADTLAHRVLVLHKDTGALACALSSAGGVPFRRPMGVAVSGHYLYIANTDNNLVAVFDKASRRYVTSIANQTGVRGLCVDPEGRLYAAVQDDCCIQVFAP